MKNCHWNIWSIVGDAFKADLPRQVGVHVQNLSLWLLGGMTPWDGVALGLSIALHSGCKVQTLAKLMKSHSQAFHFKVQDVSCYEILKCYHEIQ